MWDLCSGRIPMTAKRVYPWLQVITVTLSPLSVTSRTTTTPSTYWLTRHHASDRKARPPLKKNPSRLFLYQTVYLFSR